MKIVTLFVPEVYLSAVEELIQAGLYPSRSEVVRKAIRTFLFREKEFTTSIGAKNAFKQKERASSKKEAERIVNGFVPIRVKVLDISSKGSHMGARHCEFENGKTVWIPKFYFLRKFGRSDEICGSKVKIDGQFHSLLIKEEKYQLLKEGGFV